MKGICKFTTGFIILLVALSSCRYEEELFSTTGQLNFSTDTVTFDTIFTTIGSVTKQFKIRNKNLKDVELSSAYLENGLGSVYRLNIDGQSASRFENIRVPAQDSLYVFVEVTLEVNGSNLPMVVEDAIIFNANGVTSRVVLEAFGQDVYLIDSVNYSEPTTLLTDKPYLILEQMRVDTPAVLTIPAGAKLHFHGGANLLVLGRIEVYGTANNPVIFEGDRFDRGYDRSMGRWGTIFIYPWSRGNTINYAIIKNPTIGIRLGAASGLSTFPELTIGNTIITNSSNANIAAFGADLTAYNCVFSDSKFFNLFLSMGGNYNFYHCTVSNLGGFRVNAGLFERYERNSDGAALYLSNSGRYFEPAGENTFREVFVFKNLEQANFHNSIIWGSSKQEILFGDSPDVNFNYFFENCLLRQPEDTVAKYRKDWFIDNVLNEYPKFVNDSLTNGALNYRLETLSPATNKASFNIIDANPYLRQDFDGNNRLSDGKPDIGAYERIE